jgi:hypothetical protein
MAAGATVSAQGRQALSRTGETAALPGKDSGTTDFIDPFPTPDYTQSPALVPCANGEPLA